MFKLRDYVPQKTMEKIADALIKEGNGKYINNYEGSKRLKAFVDADLLAKDFNIDLSEIIMVKILETERAKRLIKASAKLAMKMAATEKNYNDSA